MVAEQITDNGANGTEQSGCHHPAAGKYSIALSILIVNDQRQNHTDHRVCRVAPMVRKLEREVLSFGSAVMADAMDP